MRQSPSRSAGSFCRSLILPGNSKLNCDSTDCLCEGDCNAEGKRPIWFFMHDLVLLLITLIPLIYLTRGKMVQVKCYFISISEHTLVNKF